MIKKIFGYIHPEFSLGGHPLLNIKIFPYLESEEVKNITPFYRNS